MHKHNFRAMQICAIELLSKETLKNMMCNGNKANLRDLIAAAGLVTLFGQRDLEIAWMTVKSNHLQTLKSDPYLWFLGLCNLEIWRMMIQEESQ